MASKKKKKPVVPETINAEVINQLLEKKNSQKALDFAKRFHKQYANLESEELLLRAYRLRIQQLKFNGMSKEAIELLNVAKEKCTHFSDQLNQEELNILQFPLTPQDVAQLLRAMEQEPDASDKKKHIHLLLKNGLSDIRHVLNCTALSADHPIKQESALVWEAFEAAAGEVDDADRSRRIERLSHVSRQSIFVNWCYLIRALEAFHQFDNAKTALFLERIPAESTVSRAALFLQEKMNGKSAPHGLTSKPTRILWNAMTEDSLRSQWMKISQNVQSADWKSFSTMIQTFIQSPFFSSPVALRTATQALLEEVFDQEDLSLSGRTNRFLEILHKQFDRAWGKVGTKYLLLTLCKATGVFEEPFDMAERYEELDQELRSMLSVEERAMILAKAAEWCVQGEREEANTFFFNRYGKSKKKHTNSIELYEKAIRLAPKVAYFEKLMEVHRESESNVKEVESALLEWHRAFPQDITPLIHLCEEAEKRNTLKKALDFLEKAEKIDHLHPTVRSARYRLVWLNIKKHLNQHKWHLVRKDLEHVDFSGMKPNLRMLFQSVEPLLYYLENAERSAENEAGALTCTLLIHHLNNIAKLKAKSALKITFPLPNLEENEPLTQYFDFVDTLASLNDSPQMPFEWLRRFPTWILNATDLKDELLLRICHTLFSKFQPSMVFAATRKGLLDRGPNLHKFLFYRAKLLSEKRWDTDYIHMECFFAAYRLAKERHDFEFTNLCLKHLVRYFNSMLGLFGPDVDQVCLDEAIQITDQEMEKIIKREEKRKEPNSFSGSSFKRSKKSKIINRILYNIHLDGVLSIFSNPDFENKDNENKDNENKDDDLFLGDPFEDDEYKDDPFEASGDVTQDDRTAGIQGEKLDVDKPKPKQTRKKSQKVSDLQQKLW